MKRFLLPLVITISMIYSMQEQPTQEGHEQIDRSKEGYLWRILGNKGNPNLKFRSALLLVNLPESTIRTLNIPEELKEYLISLKVKLTDKLLGILVSKSDIREKFGNSELADIRLLIESGADVNAENASFWTPLHFAAEKGLEDIMRLIIAKGANVNAKNLMGETPLMLAAKHGHTGAVQFLLSSGANFNEKASNGWTALMTAALHSWPNIVKILVEAGADTSLKNQKGRTVFDIVEDQVGEQEDEAGEERVAAMQRILEGTLPAL